MRPYGYFLFRVSDGIPLAKAKERKDLIPLLKFFNSFGVVTKIRVRSLQFYLWKEGQSYYEAREISRIKRREYRINSVS